MSKLILNVLAKSGLDTKIWKARSCRGAASSKAYQCGVPLRQILQQGRWSGEEVFRRFYLRTDGRPVLPENPNISFSEALRR